MSANYPQIGQAIQTQSIAAKKPMSDELLKELQGAIEAFKKTITV
jgi:hypothetical protein